MIDAKKIHFDALNLALGPNYSIEWNEHLSIYDGLKTHQKLEMISKNKGLLHQSHSKIWQDKQNYTLEFLKKIDTNSDIILTLKSISQEGYKIACCSNSIRKTVFTVLSRLGIIEYFDLILSNEDVSNSKPHPEIYWKAISEFGFLPEETIILEDSPPGLLAASRSRCHILRVKNSSEVNYDNISKKIKESNMKSKKMPKWVDKKLNVLIPMAGAGSRFEKAGYTFPKPLIEVNNSPMIQVVVDNLNIEANYIYVVQKSHRSKYNLDSLLNLITPNCRIVEVDGITEGAACTALLAKEFINNEDSLFFANSDQFVEWNSNDFMYKMQENQSDGGIVTFKSTHPKWSFVKMNDNGLVVEVAEKNPISDIATVGFYWWKQGKDFVKYAEQMILKNIRVSNEFYVCPVFNEAIKDNKKIMTFDVDRMWGLGTPEDLQFYIKNFSPNI